ncbi:osmoprotectant transport system permease protein [Kineococcus xinjiangensis]|uniref:Osmoprotectant transport system permease protein n=1 Tax=Kineococcus xinjiangensis TaxID=512762 RepID=A0A2S6IGW3_9ACTN|nr:osmoprotectant transport system permease protein [Kineococcus xinjiangensis]
MVSVVLASVLAFPLALLVRRRPGPKGLLLASSTVLYSIPSLALIPVMVPFTGLSPWTVVLPLALYSLAVLLRNTLAGLDGVPTPVVDAARGMGYAPARLLLTVELPLALPAILAGLRIATVSAVAMTTIGGLVGFGGLGTLLLDGQRRNFRAQVLTATVLVVALAVVVDLVLLAVQRAAGRRGGRRAAGAEPVLQGGGPG